MVWYLRDKQEDRNFPNYCFLIFNANLHFLCLINANKNNYRISLLNINFLVKEL